MNINFRFITEFVGNNFTTRQKVKTFLAGIKYANIFYIIILSENNSYNHIMRILLWYSIATTG